MERRRQLTLAVYPDLAGRTVDVLLRRELALSGTQIKQAKALPDGILLDGVPVFVNVQTSAGQILTVRLDGGEEGSGLIPVEGPVPVVYEDGDLLVVNKPAGLAVHPGPGHHTDTLGNFLTWKYKEESDFVLRAVNRLDRGTSGLMVLARHAYAQERLTATLHTGAFTRTYLAVCEGIPEPPRGVVDGPIGRAEGEVLRRVVRPDGAPARTHYQVEGVFCGRALVRLKLETGRTHQIRVHMAHLGHPLTGDFLYGIEDHALIGRTALHAAEVSFCQPVTGKRLSFSAKLPADIEKLIQKP